VIVLDTHAWIWWLSSPERLSATARDAAADAAALSVSTLSVWELATLERRGRIALDRDVRDWVRRALSDDRVVAVAPGVDVAVAAARLDSRAFPGDPADRLIYATAQSLEAPLITRDARLRAFDPTGTIW
jgi:PIN domain nuclease of toxin-antitoxin system